MEVKNILLGKHDLLSSDNNTRKMLSAVIVEIGDKLSRDENHHLPTTIKFNSEIIEREMYTNYNFLCQFSIPRRSRIS